MESEKCERCIYTYGTLGCISNVGGISVYDCDFGQEQFEKRRFLNEYLRKWLSSFNTNSATVCFTEIQELKKKVEKENE